MNSDRFLAAFVWASQVYADDVRKSSGVPALHHPMGVCELVMGAGGDEDTCIAALFHDFAEDKGGEQMLSEIRAKFGDRVERIVRDCSDTLPSEYDAKEPWIVRKVAHIKHVSSLELDSCTVLAADTLHNTRNHIQGFRDMGEDWWKNFRANVYLDKEWTPEICALSTWWYLSRKASALYSKLNNSLGRELNCTVLRFGLKQNFSDDVQSSTLLIDEMYNITV